MSSSKVVFYFKLLVTFSFFVSVQSVLYGLRLNELLKLNLLSWQPKLCPLFRGRDEDDIKKNFLGVDMAKQKDDGDKDWKPPDNVFLGVGVGSNSHNDVSRYDPDYMDKGSNKRPLESLGSKVTGIVAGLGKRKRYAELNMNEQISYTDKSYQNRVKRGLPASFDWRDHSDCASIHDIRYQECGDCWAVASASVMGDRYCLATHKDRFFSSRQVSSCMYPGEGGCDGGFPTDAMNFYKSKGVATGGDSTIKTQPAGCVPYLAEMTNKLACPSTCDSKGALDKITARYYRQIKSMNVTEIMYELVNYGPVVSVMELYEDFSYYGGGVYKHTSGKSQGFHSVRILGYGTEKGVPYWLVANSWGKDFGEKGYFKILRGSDHCHIESWITVVYPEEAYKKKL